ncbi:MAG: methyl-accepting chemotaxis protein [Pseudomonadales bacterium]|nr:methyl-accepting chemotaxis protein [Pseudomonadales bacterium]
MLIKQKLYCIGAGLCGSLVTIGILIGYAFNGLSNSFDLVVENAALNSISANETAKGLESGSLRLETSNKKMMEIVEGIRSANQRSKLVGKKIAEINGTLEELIENIDEMMEDIDDQDTLELFEEISDEASDIGERLKREGLVNITATAENMQQFSTKITTEVDNISKIDQFIKQQVNVSNASKSASNQIEAQAQQALSDIEWQQNVIVITVIGVIGFAAVSIAMIFMATLIPIQKSQKLMQDIAEGEGDLTQRLDVNGKDEMAQISIAFNCFVGKMQALVSDVNTSAMSLNSSTDKTLSAMSEGNRAIINQQTEVEQIATAVNEMNATSQAMSQYAQDAADATSHGREKVLEGKELAYQSSQSATQLAREIEGAVAIINSLHQKSTDIIAVVNVIKVIAAQTNLLALNAAIEAARAGEMGRGFAVVADEVRALAVKADQSTNDIESLINEIRSLTDNAVDSMETSRSESESTVFNTETASRILSDAYDSIQTIEEMNIQIASASEEQSTVSEEINKRVTQVHELSQHTSSEVSNVVDTCEGLSQISNKLDSQLAQFKV